MPRIQRRIRRQSSEVIGAYLYDGEGKQPHGGEDLTLCDEDEPGPTELHQAEQHRKECECIDDA